MTELNTQPLTALYRPAESAPATWAMGSLFEQLLSSADSGGSLGMALVTRLFVFKRGWPRPLVVHAARWAALCNMMRLS